MENCRVIIAGSRHFEDFDKLVEACDFYLKGCKDVTVISGGARGADKLGERYARKRGHKLEIYPAEWNRYGRAAGPIRNQVMADTATHLIAFLAPNSRGTKDMINKAHKKGLQVRIVNIGNTDV